MKTLSLSALVFLCLAVSSSSAQPIAVVGTSSINRTLLQQRIAVEEAYGGMLAPEAALVSLVNNLIEREVALRLGLLPDSTELTRFSQYVDSSSKAPQILASVKNVFGGDLSAYRSSYLLPRIVNMKLHGYFLRDSALHASARRSIERAYSLIAKGASLRDAAAGSGLRFLVDTVRDLQRPPGPPMPQRVGSSGVGSVTLNPYLTLLATMKPGEIFKTIVETDADFRVIRLSSRSDSVQVVEVITAPKGEFGTWFHSLGSTVEIRIDDRPLRESVVAKYPNLWWVRQACATATERH